MPNRNACNINLDLGKIKSSNSNPRICGEELQEKRLNDFSKFKEVINELNMDDLIFEEEIGQGSGGCVTKKRHKWTSQIMAIKSIPVDLGNTIHPKIFRELEVLHDCKSPYIVGFFGAFFNESNLHICMEFMDKGSLDSLMNTTRRFPEPIIAKITLAVVLGLSYLRTNHKIIHRDIKPSNILINSNGEVKLCDFGISGNLINSMANSFVGTKSYMAPERLQGGTYTVLADIWSLGLTLVELSVGYYPIPTRNVINDENSFGTTISEHWAAARRGILLGEIWESTCKNSVMSLFDMLGYINTQPPPQLPDIGFTMEFRDLVDSCLKKNPEHRVNLANLKNNPYLQSQEMKDLDLSNWVQKVTSTSRTDA